jgi:hypothetical protein
VPYSTFLYALRHLKFMCLRPSSTLYEEQA